MNAPMHPREARPLRIAVAHAAYRQRGGEDVVVEAEVELLRQAGAEVELYLRHNDELSDRGALGAGAELLWSRRSWREVDALLARFRPDVLHVHNTFPAISPAIYWAAARRGVPVVQTLHNFRLLCPQGTLLRQGQVCEDCVGRAPWRAVRHGCYRESRLHSAALAAMLGLHRGLGSYAHKVTRYIALNEFGRRLFIAGGLPAERILVKPNFASAPAATGSERQGGLYAGRLSPEKGIATLVEAALAAAAPELRVMGDGPLRAQVATAFGERYLGQCGRAEVADAMARAAYVVVPSICYESFSLAVVEAFAAGTPVIASRLGPPAEMVEEGVTGLLFAPGDAGDLARALAWARQHPEDMRRMGARARQRFEDAYTPERNLQQLTAIYREAIAAAQEYSHGT